MPIEVPNREDVQRLFEQSAREATRCRDAAQEMEESEFDNYQRDASHSRWEAISPSSIFSIGDRGERLYAGERTDGIWRLPVDQSIFLIKAKMEIGVVKHMDGQEGEIKGRIQSFFQPLADLMPSEASTSLRFTFCPPVDHGPDIRFGCSVKGIVLSGQ